MKIKLFQGLYERITRFLMKKRPPSKSIQLADFDRIRYEIRPGDVLLIAGRSHISDVIKLITHSPWSHAALYIGRLHDIESEKHRQMILEHFRYDPGEQLILESQMGMGTAISLLSKYRQDHLRVCRPYGLIREDAQKVINYAVEHLGREYDVRQIIDLARFLYPWSLMPRRWRSSLFEHNPGVPTHEVCSTLLAEAFSSVNFPILPMMQKDEENRSKFIERNPRLYTPSDFDYSPYFEIIKYPMVHMKSLATYRELPWDKNKVYHNHPEDEEVHTTKTPTSKAVSEIKENKKSSGSQGKQSPDSKKST